MNEENKNFVFHIIMYFIYIIGFWGILDYKPFIIIESVLDNRYYIYSSILQANSTLIGLIFLALALSTSYGVNIRILLGFKTTKCLVGSVSIFLWGMLYCLLGMYNLLFDSETVLRILIFTEIFAIVMLIPVFINLEFFINYLMRLPRKK